MGVQVVGRETNDLDIASIKLVLESGNETELGGADRGYVRACFSSVFTTPELQGIITY
jgi:hypothetical protein